MVGHPHHDHRFIPGSLQYRKPICNVWSTIDIRTSHRSLTTHSLDSSHFSVRSFLNLLPISFPPHPRRTEWLRLLPFLFFKHPPPQKGLCCYNCTFTCTTKSSSQGTNWLEDFTPLFYISSTSTYYWPRLSERKVGEVIGDCNSVRLLRRRGNPLFCFSPWAENCWGQQTGS